jgi:amidase
MKKALLLAFVPLLASAAEITGEWRLQLIRFGEQFASARVNLKAEGTKLTGTLNELKLEGSVEGDHMALTATRPDGSEWGKFDGKIQADQLSGTVKQGTEELGWKGERISAVKAAAATHTFEPTAFHRVFSGGIAPVLHLNPGDTVKTSTVDAGGMQKTCAVPWVAIRRPDPST